MASKFRFAKAMRLAALTGLGVASRLIPQPAIWNHKAAMSLTQTLPTRLYSWGQGAFGKLGLGSDANQFDPKLLSTLDGATIIDLSTGKTITACIDGDGNILTWGKPINVIVYHPGSSWIHRDRA